MTETFRFGPRVRVHLVVKDVTAKVTLQDSKKIWDNGKVEGPDPKWALEIAEVSPNGLVLDVPAGFCNQGQRLALQIETEGLDDKEARLQVTAKVIKLHLGSRRQDRESVDLEFVQTPGPDWQRLCDSFQVRQEDVLRALDAMKG